MSRRLRMVLALLRQPAAYNIGCALRYAVTVQIYALTVQIGRMTMHAGTQIALVWLATGVSFLWLKPFGRVLGGWRQPAAMGAMAALVTTTAVLNLASGTVWTRALTFAVADLTQGVVTVWVFARRRRPDEHGLTSPQRLCDLLLAATAGALAAAPFGPGLAVFTSGTPLASVFQFVPRNTVSVLVVGVVGVVGLRLARGSTATCRSPPPTPRGCSASWRPRPLRGLPVETAAITVRAVPWCSPWSR